MDVFPVTRVALRPSPRLHAFILTAHCSGICALALAAAPWWMQVSGATMLVISYAYAWRAHVALRGDAVIALEADPRRGWRVRTARYPALSAELATENLVLPWLTILRFRLADCRRRTVILIGDNVDADDFRRIRVLARAGAGAMRSADAGKP